MCPANYNTSPEVLFGSQLSGVLEGADTVGLSTTEVDAARVREIDMQVGMYPEIFWSTAEINTHVPNDFTSPHFILNITVSATAQR